MGALSALRKEPAFSSLLLTEAAESRHAMASDGGFIGGMVPKS
jgi:hypothetical protein